MLVIHEIFGLTDWAKNLADELAAAGYIAIAPDLLSAPGKDTQSYPDQDAAVKAVSALQDAQIFPDLDAAADYAMKLPACNGTLAVTGFCWGGGKSFAYANHNSHLKAAFVFYGPGSGVSCAGGQHFLSGLRLLCGKRRPDWCHHPADQGDHAEGRKTLRTSDLSGRWSRLHARRRSARCIGGKSQGARFRLGTLEVAPEKAQAS